MESNQDLYKQKMAAQIDVWTAKLEVLEARAGKATADGKVGLRAQADKLAAHKAAAQAQLDKLQASTEDTWDAVRADVGKKWDQLSGEVEAIWDSLSKPSS